MQIEVISNQPAFEPIDINIRIETAEELCDLLARLNIGYGCEQLLQAAARYTLPPIANYDLLKILDKIAVERNLIT